MGAPLTQPLSNRASEALNLQRLAFAQLHAGQVQQNIASGRRALALSQESKSAWSQVLSRVVLTYGLLGAGEWEAASRYAMKAIVLRKRTEAPLIERDFYAHYEKEALLHAGEEQQAREAVQRLGSSRGFRLPYLLSLAPS